MSNQILSFLDIDLGSYINSVANNTNIEHASNLFNSNPNLAFSEFDSKASSNNFDFHESMQTNNLDLDLSIDPMILLEGNELNTEEIHSQTSHIQEIAQINSVSNLFSPSSILDFDLNKKANPQALKSMLNSLQIPDLNNNISLMDNQNDSTYLSITNKVNHSNLRGARLHSQRNTMQLYSNSLESLVSNPMRMNDEDNSNKHDISSSMSFSTFNLCDDSFKSHRYDNDFNRVSSNIQNNHLVFSNDSAGTNPLVNNTSEMTHFMYKNESIDTRLINTASDVSGISYLTHQSANGNRRHFASI